VVAHIRSQVIGLEAELELILVAVATVRNLVAEGLHFLPRLKL